MSAAVETYELSKDYSVGFWRPRPYRALDKISFEVEPGGVFGFLGPNGAGKTTTLKLLMQLVFPTSGTAKILGKPVGDVSVKRRIGFLPENPYFYDNLTAEELLGYFASLFGYKGQERKKRVSRLLDEVGVGAERRLQLRKFSKGMIQRVGLAQAIVNDPEVVFLDEPMSGLDPLGRREVRQLILRLRDEGRTVFFSSHILADAEALCSRIAIVAKGRLMAAGSLADILAVRMLGWEIVVDGLAAPPDWSHTGLAVQKVTKIDELRYALEVAPHVKPEDAVAQIAGKAGRLISVNPIRETLEDFFVRQVAEAGNRSRFLDAPESNEKHEPRQPSRPDDDDMPQAAAGGR
jgi:ABC-2 type transport system ATP-binding protein